MNIIFGNYGDGTIALIQWAHENALNDVLVCTVETGFASTSETWQQHLQKGQGLALKCGFRVKTLSAVMTWSELILQRQAFPNPQFSWCAGWLKGMTFLDYLDEVDPSCVATILLPKHTTSVRGDVWLQEWEDHSPHFGDRRVWQPLYNLNDTAFYELIHRAGFSPLRHRSLECAPCIYSTPPDLSRLTLADQHKVAELEHRLQQPLFAASAYDGAEGIAAVVEWAQKHFLDTHSISSCDATCAQPSSGVYEQVHEQRGKHTTKSQLERRRVNQDIEYPLGCGTPFACGE